MRAGETRKLRADAAAVTDFLEKLDEAAAAAESSQDTVNVRENDRYRYRVDSLVVEFCDPAGTWTRYEVPSRNISRTGVCVVLGHFAYANTECRVHLVSLYGHSQPVRGKVVRCRYVPGSGRMHEVGIQFSTPIDVGLFYRGATYTRALVAAAESATQRAVERVLKAMQFDIVIAKTGMEAVELTSQQSFDMLLAELELPAMNGAEAVRELRNRGFSRPVVALTPGTEEEISQRCLEAGFTSWSARPYNRETLGAVVEALRAEPIVSAHLRDPKMATQIDSFVRDLPERAREMEVAIIEKDFESIGRTARMLKESGLAHGFEPISRHAEAVTKVCDEKAPPAAVRENLNALTRTMVAARPVSCLEWQKQPTRASKPAPEAKLGV
jgi:CheY-like chemotaxis protein